MLSVLAQAAQTAPVDILDAGKSVLQLGVVGATLGLVAYMLRAVGSFLDKLTTSMETARAKSIEQERAAFNESRNWLSAQQTQFLEIAKCISAAADTVKAAVSESRALVNELKAVERDIRRHADTDARSQG